MSTFEDSIAHYASLAEKFDVFEVPDYGSLVTPNGNAREPVHRWFHLKEAYSHLLLGRVLKDVGLLDGRPLKILDPFSGSGTTAISALDLVDARQVPHVDFLGYEANPFLHLLSSTKAAACLHPFDQFETYAGTIAARASESDAPRKAAPGLSTFNREEFFSADHLKELLSLSHAIDSVAAPSDLARDLARLCLAVTIEPASTLRRDGRTLRRSAGKLAKRPIDSFLEAAGMVHEDTPSRRRHAQVRIAQGDSRTSLTPETGTYDLAIFSPPYPNNIDYTEVYKLENWLLGLIPDQDAFAQARIRSLRSHGSLTWADKYDALEAIGQRSHDLLGPVLAAVPQNRYTRKRRQLVQGYADDMLQILQACSRALKPGGSLVCVVGNSLHGTSEASMLVASDLIIAEMATWTGLTVERIDIARYPRRKRTDTGLLRESLVVCRKE